MVISSRSRVSSSSWEKWTGLRKTPSARGWQPCVHASHALDKRGQIFSKQFQPEGSWPSTRDAAAILPGHLYHILLWDSKSSFSWLNCTWPPDSFSEDSFELQLLSCFTCKTHRASLVAKLVKNWRQCRRPQFNSWFGKIPCRRDRLPTPVFLGFPGGSDGKESTYSTGCEDPLEEGIATHSSILAWRIPTERVYRVTESQTQLSD